MAPTPCTCCGASSTRGGAPHEPVTTPPAWSRTAQRIGISSAFGLLVVGVLYVSVIVAWMLVVGTPADPVGDPYLATMEGLTIVSAVLLVGFCAAIACLCEPERKILGVLTLVTGALAAALTISVHFVQLTAVRQMWREGMVDDYRLVWPSRVFAVEYVAWDLLVGCTMILAAASLGPRPERRRARFVLGFGGACCLAGLLGPASGQMRLQTLGIVGYALLLPAAAYLTAGVFWREPPVSGAPLP